MEALIVRCVLPPKADWFELEDYFEAVSQRVNVLF